MQPTVLTLSFPSSPGAVKKRRVGGIKRGRPLVQLEVEEEKEEEWRSGILMAHHHHPFLASSSPDDTFFLLLPLAQDEKKSPDFGIRSIALYFFTCGETVRS